MTRSSEHHFKKTAKKRLIKQAGGVCSICGSSHTTNNPLEIHHKLSVSNGGLTIEKNAQVVCRKCHAKLHNGG